jgi:hypothetical protein
LVIAFETVFEDKKRSVDLVDSAGAVRAILNEQAGAVRAVLEKWSAARAMTAKRQAPKAPAEARADAASERRAADVIPRSDKQYNEYTRFIRRLLRVSQI